MRLKDADELMIKLQWHCDLYCSYTEQERDVMCDACFLGDAKDYIESMPTVDAVEIVRCKDCRWFENDGYHTNCKIMQFCIEAEDYCSRGERREDGKIG